MGYHPRIESKTRGTFQTTRSRNSEMWFINNTQLEHATLGYLAKFKKRYSAKVYAFSMEGNHVQFPALFPEGNRSHFMRDLNSCIARAIPRYAPRFRGGRFWARRYSSEFLPAHEDIEEQFFYTVLQPVQDGLVERISDYPGYNCFSDAINGIERKYKVVNWAAYNVEKQRNPEASIADFIEEVSLKFDRLPGYEMLSQKDYAKRMKDKLSQRQADIVNGRLQKGLGFMGRDALLKAIPGSIPNKTKTSTRKSYRPRVLSKCSERRAECRAWYFSIYFQYKEASRAYRRNEATVRFPPDTYKPYIKSSLT